jgi:hypothetical protein
MLKENLLLKVKNMSRFYQTSRSTPVDWAYDMPFQEMFQGLVAKQSIQDAGRAIGDKAEAQGQTLQFLNRDKGVAQEGMQWINDSVDEFSNQDLTDPVNRNKLNSFSKEVARSFSPNGKYGNVQGNYDAYKTYAKGLDDNKNLQEFQREAAKNHWLEKYDGVGGEAKYGDDYNSFQGKGVTDYVDLNSEWNTIAKEIQSNKVERGGSSAAGMYIQDWNKYEESTPQDRMAIAYSGLLRSPKIQNYLNEGKEYGWLDKKQFEGDVFSVNESGKLIGGNQSNYLGAIYNAGAAQKGYTDKQTSKLKSDGVKIAQAKIQAYNDSNKPYLPETRDTSIANRLRPELNSAIKDLSEGKKTRVENKLTEFLTPAQIEIISAEYAALEQLQGDGEGIAGWLGLTSKTSNKDKIAAKNKVDKKLADMLKIATGVAPANLGSFKWGVNSDGFDVAFELDDISQFTGAFVDPETKSLISNLTGQTADQINSMSGTELTDIATKYDAWSYENGMSLASSTPLYGKAQAALNNRFFNQASGFNTEGKADKIMIRKPGSDEAKLATKDDLADMDAAIKKKVSNGSVAAFTANNALEPEYIGGYRAQVNVNDGDTWEVYIPTDDNINLGSSQQFAQVLATGQGAVSFGNSEFNFSNKWNPETKSITASVSVTDRDNVTKVYTDHFITDKNGKKVAKNDATNLQQVLNSSLKSERQGIFENFAGNLNQQMSVSKGGEMLLNSDASD